MQEQITKVTGNISLSNGKLLYLSLIKLSGSNIDIEVAAFVKLKQKVFEVFHNAAEVFVVDGSMLLVKFVKIKDMVQKVGEQLFILFGEDCW